MGLRAQAAAAERQVRAAEVAERQVRAAEVVERQVRAAAAVAWARVAAAECQSHPTTLALESKLSLSQSL